MEQTHWQPRGADFSHLSLLSPLEHSDGTQLFVEQMNEKKMLRILSTKDGVTGTRFIFLFETKI